MKQKRRACQRIEYASPEERKELTRRIGAMRLFAKYERAFKKVAGESPSSYRRRAMN